MDRRERFDNQEETLRALSDAMRGLIRTAMPGIVVAFDPDAATVSVQPAIQQVFIATGEGAPLPVLQDVPVVFPGGGGCSLTFPVAAGDECLLIFSARDIDAWWQSGGVQPPASARMHSLSDGFALVGVRSKPRAIPNISTTSVQLRTDDGAAFFEIESNGGLMRIVAPAGLQIEGNVTVFGGDVEADDVSLKAHVHSGVERGGGNTDPPVS